ncbi:MAG: FIST C-terminal domain-containing protein [Pirellulales bacterium]|nr:FIST C-terminal domain-containing protein [Pirellulales bacterium]
MSAAEAKFAAALSTRPDLSAATAEACRVALEGLGVGEPADLALAFISPQYGDALAGLGAEIKRRTGAALLAGCTGESIVGGAREVEGEPALALWLARLPGVELVPMHLELEQTPEGGTIVGWSDRLPARWPESSGMLLLGEPFSFPAELLLERLNEDQPGVPVMGGMASGGWTAGQNRLFLDDQMFDSGALAIWLQGAVRLRSIVSQGCRPIGRHFVVTKAERNVIYELSGQPALKQLAEIFQTLSPEEQQLARSGLHVGSVINEYQESFARGDFLVRNVLGVDTSTGAIAIGDFVRVGQTVQFHLRDAASADEDLRELLAAAPTADAPPQSRGALLFTCNGRGTRLFETPHHDAGALQSALGDVPVAGFFAQGEAGPVGGKNFLHGFTASVALFEPVDASSIQPT